VVTEIKDGLSKEHKKKKEFNLSKLNHVLVCIGFTREKIGNIHRAGIESIEAMIEARASNINNLVGVEIKKYILINEIIY